MNYLYFVIRNRKEVFCMQFSSGLSRNDLERQLKDSPAIIFEDGAAFLIYFQNDSACRRAAAEGLGKRTTHRRKQGIKSSLSRKEVEKILRSL